MAANTTFWQRITYAYGRGLPDHLQDWVREDLTGEGAVRRRHDPIRDPADFCAGLRCGCCRHRCTCTPK
ncbi:hypothetical protein MAUB1S_04647 [Mycolicibacterium aubagnense]